ncbi:MAG: ubiquinone biosynthesis protein [Actinomycetota bacterium]|nr:ubiquinone biosynthesis protein [Actinomycetota bacterium]
MRKRDRVLEVAGVLGELLAGEAKLRWQRSRNGLADPEDFERERARALRQTLEQLGPLYIKVGQVLSTRPDLVSQTVIDALQDLHEQVMVRPFSEFEPVLERNLGAHWRYRFKEIDTEVPLGAASIAQVYRAVQNDGLEVVLKVQRPGVAAGTRLDMEILAQAVKLVVKRAPTIEEIFQPEAMLEVIFGAMRPEIDFTAEAANMEDFREMLEQFDHLAVPEVLDVTKEVLVMTKAPGVSIRECVVDDFSSKERELIGRDLCAMLFHGFMVDGLFHADPHPGNVFVAPGEPATVIDFGMVGRIDRRMALGYTRFMMATALNDGEAAGRAALEMGTLTSRANIAGFLSDMQRYIPTMAHQSLANMEFGNDFNQFLVFCTKRGIAVNPSIALFGKATANLEGTLRRFAPELTPFDVFRDTMGDIIKDQAKQLVEQEELLRIANEAFFASRSIPEQVRYLAQAVVNGQYVLRIRDDSAVLHEEREDARARALRRTLVGVAAAALWYDHRRRRPPS